jgi:hypothetical protein
MTTRSSGGRERRRVPPERHRHPTAEHLVVQEDVASRTGDDVDDDAMLLRLREPMLVLDPRLEPGVRERLERLPRVFEPDEQVDVASPARTPEDPRSEAAHHEERNAAALEGGLRFVEGAQQRFLVGVLVVVLLRRHRFTSSPELGRDRRADVALVPFVIVVDALDRREEPREPIQRFLGVRSSCRKILQVVRDIVERNELGAAGPSELIQTRSHTRRFPAP